MEKRKVGILHPGNMGISVAASIQRGGHSVLWVSKGRSDQTRQRAEKYHLEDVGSLDVLCETCDVIVSVCPPHAAEDVAEQVSQYSFAGTYLDANAIAPQRAARIGKRINDAGAAFLDGGIIGPPAWEPGTTWLYLSGERAAEIAALFDAGPMETSIVSGQVGQASALKMCYAAYTKGTSALLCAILTAADRWGVQERLEEQWSRNWPRFAEQTRERVRQVTAKAWRFRGEMEEIAATFREAGLPEGFHAAAAEIFGRIAGYRNAAELPALEEVLATLAHAPGPRAQGFLSPVREASEGG